MSRFATILNRLVSHEEDIESAAENERIARGFFSICAASFFSKLADALASPKITLTWMMQAIGAPAFAISLLVPIRESGSMLPQVLLARFVNSFARKTPLYQLGAAAQAVSIALMVMVIAFFDGLTAGWLIVILVAAFSLGRCLCSLVSKPVLGKVIPKSLRGQTTGWASSVAGLAICAVAAFLIVQNQIQSMTIGTSLLVGACAGYILAAVLYGLIKEPAADTQSNNDKSAESIIARLRLLKTDKTFARFVLIRALLMSSALVAPYYILIGYGEESSVSLLGGLMLSSGLAQLCSSAIWGRSADSSSRRTLQMAGTLVFLTGSVTFIVHQFSPALIDTIWLLPALYFALEVAHQGIRVARKTYLVNLGSDDKSRVDYVSVSNSIIGGLLLAFGVMLGLLSLLIQPIWLIVILSLLCLAGSVLCFTLKEA